MKKIEPPPCKHEHRKFLGCRADGSKVEFCLDCHRVLNREGKA